MVHLKKNLKKFLVIFLVCVSLNRALADKEHLNECLADMRNTFGLNTPALECFRIAIKDVLFDELRHHHDIMYYLQNKLKYNAINEGTKLPKQFCLFRALDSFDGDLDDLSDEERENLVVTIGAECLDEIECFGESLVEVIENAINYHKIGIRPEQYADKIEYFFHAPGSHGEAYLNHIADDAEFSRDIEDKVRFCYRINNETFPEEDTQE